MKRLVLAGLLSVAAGSVARGEGERFQVFQGYVAPGAGDAGKGPQQTPVVIKVDAETGDTWRLAVLSNGHWWLPIKNGVIADKKAPSAEEKPEEPAAAAPK